MGVLIDTEDPVLSFLNYLASGVVKWKHSPQQTKTFHSTHNIMRCSSNCFPYHKENVFLIHLIFPLYGVELMIDPLSGKKIKSMTLHSTPWSTDFTYQIFKTWAPISQKTVKRIHKIWKRITM